MPNPPEPDHAHDAVAAVENGVHWQDQATVHDAPPSKLADLVRVAKKLNPRNSMHQPCQRQIETSRRTAVQPPSSHDHRSGLRATVLFLRKHTRSAPLGKIAHRSPGGAPAPMHAGRGGPQALPGRQPAAHGHIPARAGPGVPQDTTHASSSTLTESAIFWRGGLRSPAGLGGLPASSGVYRVLDITLSLPGPIRLGWRPADRRMTESKWSPGRP